MIDLRSDTVTKPSKFMKQFMMEAALGDDVFQDDPTVQKLKIKQLNYLEKKLVYLPIWHHD